MRTVVLSSVLVLTAVAVSRAGDVTVRGELFYSVERQVTCPYGGTLVEISVEVGRDVTKGDELVRYTLPPRARMELEQMLSRAPVLAAVEAMSEQAALEEAEQMQRDKLGTARQAQQARRRLGVLGKRLDAARERAGQEARQLETRRTWVRRVTGLEEDRLPETLVLRAPIAGTVVWISPEARPGMEGQPDAPLLTIGLTDPMIVRAHVHELDVVHLKPGDPADLTLLAVPDLALKGTISRVAWAPFPHYLPEPSYFEIELTVPNPDRRLKKGYKADLLFRKPDGE